MIKIFVIFLVMVGLIILAKLDRSSLPKESKAVKKQKFDKIFNNKL